MFENSMMGLSHWVRGKPDKRTQRLFLTHYLTVGIYTESKHTFERATASGLDDLPWVVSGNVSPVQGWNNWWCIKYKEYFALSKSLFSLALSIPLEKLKTSSELISEILRHRCLWISDSSVCGLSPPAGIGFLQLTGLRCDALPPWVHTFFSGSDCTCFLLRAPEYNPLGKPNSTPGVR